MKTYHKIQSIFKRDPENKYKTFLKGQWSVEAFGLLRDLIWQFTEKIDGTNIRIGWNDVEKIVTLGGRSDNAQLPGQLRIYLENKFTPDLMSQLSGPVTLIGEGYGGKIQKGSGYQQEQRFILFDVFIEPWPDCPTGLFLDRNTVEEIAGMLDIPYTPVVFSGPLMLGYGMLANDDCKPLLSLVAENQELVMEGFVARPSVELRDRMGHRIITKIKAKDFPGDNG